MTRRLAASIAIATALATSGVWADTTATYATGDTSLADGKVLFEYDESDNITKLTMTPGADEKLILTGDSLPFAAGAQMVFPASGGGTNVIANPFTTAGALEFSGPTNMTWGGSDYLPNDGTYVTILENVNLDDIVPTEGYGMNGSSAPTYGAEDNLYAPYFIVRNGDNMRYELRHGIRYVFVELVQDGTDIKGRVLLSGRSGNAISADTQIFNYNDGVATAIEGVNTTYKPYAYEEQKWLAFSPRYGTPKLTFAVSKDITLPAISGNGVDVTFDANAFGESDTSFTSGTLRCNSSWMTLTTEYTLSELTLRTGSVYGSYINSSDPEGKPAIVFGWENNGSAASCQLQQRDGNIVRGVDLEFRQNGDAVEIKWVQALYLNTIYADSFYGKQKLTTSTTGINMKANDPAKLTVNWLSTIANVVTVTANGANTMTDGAYVIKGDASHPIAFDVDNLNALPDGTTDCYGNADLYINVGANNSGVSDGKSVITMHDGSRLHQESKNAFKKGTQHIALDGSTLYVNKDSAFTNDTVWTYLDYLELSNASQVTGGVVRAVHTASNPTWSVTGTGASVCDASIYLVQKSWNALTIDVADTVAGDETDFIFNGEARCNSFGAGLKKTGSGTMLVNGVISNSTYIAEGTLLLGKSGAIATGEDTQVKFELQGGTLALAAGTENAVNGVTLTENSIISMGAGASLTIASLTIPEGKTLGITFAGAVDSRSVKVSSALDSATLSRIRLNGKRARRSDAGYLYIGGFVISIF